MRNPRIFGSTSRSEDTDKSDLDILVDVPAEASLYDLAQVEMELEAILGCKVEVLTKGFMAPDVLDRAEIDLILMPCVNARPPTGWPIWPDGASVFKVTKGAPGVDGQDFADIEAYGVERWLGELALAFREELQGVDRDAFFLSTVLQDAASKCAEAIWRGGRKAR
jgi:predicted nucleotidyltransferase